MAVHDFVIELMEALLHDQDLALTEQDIRFYDKGTTADDENVDSSIKWRNARYFNEDSNVVRGSTLIVQLPFGQGAEYVNFHVGDLYRIYRKDGMQRVFPIVKDDIKNAKAALPQNIASAEQFGDYEAVRELLIIRPLNYDQNDKVLTRGVCRRVGDMALVLYFSLGSAARGGAQNILSAMVPRELLQSWNVDEKDVFDRALENTMRLQPPVLCSIAGGLGSGLKAKQIRFMEEDESVSIDFDTPLAPALSTEQEVNGAIAAFYPGVLERLYRMIGGDFYLVFTSIYDVHIHPANGTFKVSSMRSTLAGMNQNVNSREELLTRQIYRYHGEEKELTVV